jgi:tetratricopeptide (TPR) repeat protein
MTLPWVTRNGQRVKRTFLLLSWLLLAPCPLLIAQLSLRDQAQLAWQNRDKPGQTEQAIGLWDQAFKAEPGRAELLIDLTKACGRAVRHASSIADRKRWADRAREYGEKAVRINPASSDAYAAYGEALGQWANAHKGLRSLKTVQRAVDALNQAVSLNPKNAYAHMLLSSFYREAPGVVSVGDKAKALKHAKEAVAYGPGYAINHLVLARACLDQGQKEEAIKELQTILALTAPADALPETRADQDTAQKLLQDLVVAPPAIPCGQTGGYCSEQEHP